MLATLILINATAGSTESVLKARPHLICVNVCEASMS
jgi:hypothetical protein